MPFYKKPTQPLQVLQVALPNGIAANLMTVKAMQKIARSRAGHPLVRDFAHQILLDYGIASNDYLNEALSIGDFVKRNVRYVKDAEGIEQLTDPLTLIDKISRDEAQGDCDDMALLIATLLLSIGHTPAFCAVKYEKDAPNYAHIYVVDYVDTATKEYRVSLDAILKKKPIGFEVPSAVKDEFPA